MTPLTSFISFFVPQIIMDIFTHPSLPFLLFLMSSILPVMASFPDPPQSQPGLLDLLVESAERSAGLTERRLIAYQQQQRQRIAAEDFLRDTEDTRARASGPYSRPSSLREEARITDTGLLRELLDRIRKGVLAVGKGRQQWLKLQRLSQSSKRGPTNHFLRIGRSGNGGDTSGGAGSGSRLSNLRRDFRILSRLLSATDEPSRGFSEEEEEEEVSDVVDDAPYGWLLHQDDDENGAEEYERFNSNGDADSSLSKRFATYPRRSAFLRFGRRFYPRNNFVRIGRTDFFRRPSDSFTRISRSITAVPRASGIVPTGRQNAEDEYDENEARARYLNDVLRLARRSHVRIGRLPSSVFLQRLRLREASRDHRDDTLARMRSPGFRFTKSGIVRAGKRTHG